MPSHAGPELRLLLLVVGDQDLLLAAEVPEDRRGRDLDGFGDRLDRGGVVSALGEQCQGAADDLLPQLFDLRTGAPKTLPAYEPIETYAVRIDGDLIKLEVE